MSSGFPQTDDMPVLRCSVVDPAHRAVPVDLTISVPDRTTWADVSHQVTAEAGLAPDTRFTVDKQPVSDDVVVGWPPLLNGALLVADTGAPGVASARGLLELHVVAGPDSGRIHPIRPGGHRIGRSPSADVRLVDADLSRWHARLTVTAEGVALNDLGSVNGTSVDQVTVGTEPHPITAGQRIHVGRSTLALRSPAVRLAVTRVTGQGLVEVNQAPRPRPDRHPPEVRRPTPPTDAVAHRWSWTAMLLPLAVAVPIALVTRQPIFLLFALMSPVMLVANTISDRGHGRRDRREADRLWREQSQDVDRLVAAALAEEVVARRAAAPDAAELLRTVTRPSARLWERAPGSTDVLNLLLGNGRVAADVRVTDGSGGTEVQYLEDAPVVVSLTAHGHLGVAGARPHVIGVARHLVSQLAAWHGPALVQLVVLTCDERAAADWGWARWLPHVRDGGLTHDRDQAQAAVSAMHDVVRDRVEQGRTGHGRWAGPYTVVVLDSASALRSLPGLADLLVRGPSVGIHSLCLDEDLAGLAGECGAILELRADGGRLITDDCRIDPVRWDAVGAGWVQTVARALAPLRDATPAAGAAALPSDVRLLDLLDVDTADPAAILDGWNRCGASTSAVIGVDHDGPAEVDLRRDGPHALVAGTTGAGKSELLQSLVAALAVANRPDEMSFVLVDYKGGAAFSGCVDLPHTAGLVTDLDEHLAARALASLGAELNRREHALKALSCKDIEAYHSLRQADPALPALARLVVVIDEFRLLAEELPAFVSGLVRVAAVGRSLGVHLILATQRPAGIVSADIKANVNLRIALRVRDRADSDDVVDAPDAARIDAGTPGRAVCRSGSSELRALQVARVTGSASSKPAAIEVVRSDRPTRSPSRPPNPDDDLSVLVSSLRAATARGRIRPAPPAWLPPLPRLVTLDELRPDVGGVDLPHVGIDGGRCGVGIGLVDLPAQQRQPVLRWHPVDDGHLGLAGGPGSGRTSGLVSTALAMADAYPPAELHLHVIDAAAGQLRDLLGLPHVGTVLTIDQPRLVSRLVHRLTSEVRRRSNEPAGDGRPHPALVLLVDGWDALVEALDTLDHGRSTEALTALLRDGRAAGLRAVVTGDRALLTSRLTAVVPNRLLLRVTDPTDLLLAGLAGTPPAADPPPGRAVRTRDGAAVQLAAAPSDLHAALARVDERWRPGGAVSRDGGSTRPEVEPPLRLVELTTTVSLDHVLARLASLGPLGRTCVLGLGGDEGQPVVLDLDVDPVSVVAGPPGSGRSTALRTIARSLHGAGLPVLTVCPRPSPLHSGPWPVLSALDDRVLAKHLDAEPGSCVLVDDAELLVDSPVDLVLDGLARRRPDRSSAGLVLAGTTTGLLATFRGAAASARAARTGLLLRPTVPSDGEVLGIRAEPPDRTGPGRGLFVLRGEQQPVQVAT